MNEYIPKPDLEGINSPANDSPIKDVAILLLGFLGIVIAVYFLVIQVSDWALTRISLKTEVEVIGKLWKASGSEKKNPENLNLLVAKISQHVDFPLNVSVMCETSPNAMALPGGKIFITSGLLEEIKTENGLVFVLGHEIGHFINRDHIRGIGRQVVFSLGSALMGLGDIGSIASVNNVIARTYDRSQESSADDVGLEILQKIYGHTWGAEELFQVLAKNESGIEKSLARFASTHPPSQDRIERIKKTQIGGHPPIVLPDQPYSAWSKEAGCL